MKTLALTFALLTSAAFAQSTPWTETFRLPEGMTHRALAAGYDCGTFGDTYVPVPARFQAHNVVYRQLAADKDLNKFLIEATFTGSESNNCIIGVYLDRNRDDKTLDFTHAMIKTEGPEESCLEGKEFITQQMLHTVYEGSRRGLRYVAVQVMDEANEVCAENTVRIVFDRRLAP